MIILGAVLALTSCEAGSEPPAKKLGAITGAAGAGDPYLPDDGNGGYDVQNYDLDLRVTPQAESELSATATITADATKALSRFDLDLSGLTVSRVTVNGASAAYARHGGELVVTPASPVGRGRFTVGVAYSGTPRTVQSGGLGRYGWIRTHDGVFIGAEPDGAHTWFPGSDHPSDKATFGFRVTVPRGLTAIANGTLTGTANGGQGTTYTWREREPMATYLATVDVGRFNVRTGRTPGGIPVYAAVDPNATGAPDVNTLYKETAQITDAWVKLFGPYPFEETGGIVDDADVQFALETQTKPEYGVGIGSDPAVLAHELSHQWFGDSVSLNRWSDIWLNEGFATYAEWLWDERLGRTPVKKQFTARYARVGDQALWNVAPADPGIGQLFGRSVYERGAMTLQALRDRVGDRTFFAILRAWAAQHRYGNATTADFVALAERMSGKDLKKLFHVWLYERGRPANW